MSQKYIRMAQLATAPGKPPGRLPNCPNSIYRWIRQGRFPQPVRLGGNTVAWRLEDVEQWEREREARG